MTAPEPPAPAAAPPGLLDRSRPARVVALLAGLVACQAVWYGPSLVGRRVLLPLDLLVQPGGYRPAADAAPPRDPILLDLVHGQPVREYVAAELRAGRLPLWDPMSYAGSPIAMWPKYDPVEWLYAVAPVPATVAWMQLVRAVLAGVGAYLFFRRAVGAAAVPALAGGWCYPLTGYFLYWQGYSVANVAGWLPWVLLGVWLTARRPLGWGPVVLALATALCLVAGHVDISAQLLVTAGLYALWLLAVGFARPFRPRAGAGAVAGLAAGWAVGFALAAPYWMPVLDYAATGDRVVRRAGGQEDRPPAGPAVVPQLLIPEFHGHTRDGTPYLGETGTMPESAATGYAGLVAALLAAPLAWTGRHRRDAGFWLGLGLLAVSWQLAVPVVIDLMRLPGVNLVSHNRWTFTFGFAVLTLAVMGLDRLARDGPPGRRWWFLGPAAAALLLAGECGRRLAQTDRELGSRIVARLPNAGHGLAAGSANAADPPSVYDAVLRTPPAATPEQHAAVGRAAGPAFAAVYVCGLAVAGLAAAGWAVVGRPPAGGSWLAPAVGLVMVGELVLTGRGVNPQTDPALYYPRLPALERLADARPGRTLCAQCLHPELPRTHRLREVRGYDGIDPGRLVATLRLARDPRLLTGPQYAVLSQFTPRLSVRPDGVLALSPVLDMLDVRYLVVREPYPAGVRPLWEDGGYAVFENPRAAGRAYVPRRAVQVPAGPPTLDRLKAADFDPRAVVYVDRPVAADGEATGSAAVTAEDDPREVEVTADLTAPGVVVLADQWYDGWTATVDGRPVPVLRANNVLRAVELPAGRSVVRFRYDPPGHVRGVRLCLAAAVGLAGYAGWLVWRGRRRGATAAPG